MEMHRIIRNTLMGLEATAREKIVTLGAEEAKDDLKQLRDMAEELINFWDMDERYLDEYDQEIQGMTEYDKGLDGIIEYFEQEAAAKE